VLIVVIASSTKVMPASFLPWQPFQPTKMHLGCPYTLWVLLCRLWTYNRHLVQNPSFHYMSKMCINMGPKCVWAQPWIRPRTQIREKKKQAILLYYLCNNNYVHILCWGQFCACPMFQYLFCDDGSIKVAPYIYFLF
jgi:hypothetical protein